MRDRLVAEVPSAEAARVLDVHVRRGVVLAQRRARAERLLAHAALRPQTITHVSTTDNERF